MKVKNKFKNKKIILTYEQYLLIKSASTAGVRLGIDLIKTKLNKEIDAIDDECEARNVSVVQVLKDWENKYI
jgi:hypothetical protein|tara:strand:- start:284 stop:499 length:216 start_codon:yes stop_codon:yes gene_type:complete